MLSSGTGFPRNAICAACYEGAKAIIGFLNKDEQEDDHGSVNSRISSKLNGSTKVELVCSLRLFQVFLILAVHVLPLRIYKGYNYIAYLIFGIGIHPFVPCKMSYFIDRRSV